MQRNARPDAGARLRSEILEQPAAIARLLERERAGVESLAKRLRRSRPPFVYIAARGTSDNAARYAQYALGLAARIPVALAAPSLVTLYQKPPRLRGALVIGVSQSGRSPDVVETVAAARRGGAATVAIVNDTNSPLAEAARDVIALHCGDERSVAATKTYTSQLAAVALLAAALAGSRARILELYGVARALARALEAEPRIQPLAAALARADRAVVIARGVHRGTAHEISLKLKELALMHAEPYSSADFEHGPIALADATLDAVVVAPPATAARPELLSLSRRLRAKGCRVFLLGPSPASIPAVPEWLSPIAAAPAGQWLAFHAAIARGLDPDRPRGIHKITETT